ncbi:MAG: hypothetical protein ACKVQK_21810 [Burkholderiales bacterium]
MNGIGLSLVELPVRIKNDAPLRIMRRQKNSMAPTHCGEAGKRVQA